MKLSFSQNNNKQVMRTKIQKSLKMYYLLFYILLLFIPVYFQDIAEDS
jgi:hypothetical protein